MPNCLQHTYVPSAIEREMENDKRQQKTEDRNTRNSESTDGCNFFIQFVFCDVSITLNEIFSNLFLLWKAKTAFRKQNCAVFDLILLWKLAKIY